MERYACLKERSMKTVIAPEKKQKQNKTKKHVFHYENIA